MNLTLRSATVADARMLLDWRNDPETRANSINTNKVEWTSHVGWLEKTLINPNRRLFVVMDGERSVGTVRLDDDSSRQETELSWTIAPAERGRGHAKAMIGLALKGVKSGQQALAKIKPANIASIKVARANGFELVSPGLDQNGLLVWWRQC